MSIHRIRILLLALFSMAFLLPACGGDGGGENNDAGADGLDDGGVELSDQVQIITGRILDENLQALPSAQIRLAELTSSSDSGGRFGIESRAALGARTLQIEAEGYLPGEKTLPAGGGARQDIGPIIMRKASAHQEIDGALGGSLLDTAQGLEIIVPAGAFAETVSLSVTRIPLGDPLREDLGLPAPLPRPDSGGSAGLFALQIDTGGIQPSAELQVRVQTPVSFPTETQVPVGRYDAARGTWIDVGLATTDAEGWLVFSTDHLSTFAASLPALPAQDHVSEPDPDGLQKTPCPFLPGDPRIDPIEGTLQVGVPLPPLIRRGQRLQLSLFHDSRSLAKSLPIPIAAADGAAGEKLIATVHSPFGPVRIGMNVKEAATEKFAPASLLDMEISPAPETVTGGDPEALGDLARIQSGSHAVEVVLDRPTAGLLAESDSNSFTQPVAGALIRDAGDNPIATPSLIRLGHSLKFALPMDNRSTGPFGPGWHLSGLTRLLQPFCSNEQATVVGEMDRPAITYGSMTDLVSQSLHNRLIDAGLRAEDIRHTQVAFTEGAAYVSIRDLGRVYKLNPGGASVMLVAGGGAQSTDPGQGLGTDLNLGTIETINSGPRGEGLLIMTPNYITHLKADGQATRIVGTGASSAVDDVQLDQSPLQSTFAGSLAASVAADPSSNRIVFSKFGDGAFEVKDGLLKRLRLRESSTHCTTSRSTPKDNWSTPATRAIASIATKTG